ncbi:uncharacterized protein LOC126575424 [Anopheles aquasalis]|uniref:uncharacterized protein LOC126575424 n=1 Tax=Anopheles aquasalis TaxID=42839 RepID=UPI00215AEA1C|nr:uncharacterized protein LOC126575424 [Anopheles aquasalis]
MAALRYVLTGCFGSNRGSSTSKVCDMNYCVPQSIRRIFRATGSSTTHQKTIKERVGVFIRERSFACRCLVCAACRLSYATNKFGKCCVKDVYMRYKCNEIKLMCRIRENVNKIAATEENITE